MNATISRFQRILLTFVCLSMLLTTLLGGVAPVPQARASDASGARPKPSLTDISDPAKPASFVVTGKDFTPGGLVYLAIYDQAGAVLYEHRSIHATSALSADQAARLSDHRGEDIVASAGGAVRATFTGLCGAAAMMRAEDVTTSQWTGWLSFVPNCPTTNPAGIANDFNVSLRLPVATTPVPAYAVANDVNGAAVAKPAAPLLLIAPQDADHPGDVVVTGLAFSPTHQIYIAVYDQMGAQLYPGRWITSTVHYNISGMTDYSPEAHPIVAMTAEGNFQETLTGLCNANLMIRAYDAFTYTWSNWVESSPTC